MKHFRIIAIALLLLAIITLPVVAGGAGESAKDEDIVTLRFWGGVPPEAGPQASVDLFNEQYADKGIRVEYERFVNDDTGNLKLETNLLSGDGVDLYMTYTTDILAKRAEGNMALDLSELIERDGFDLTQYGGSLMESYYINGKPYCVPTKLDQYGIVLNKDMFDAAGIPIPTEWTFDEFREVAKKLTHGEGQDKVYGMFWNSQQDLTYILSYLVAQTNGGDPMYLSETESAFTDPVVLAAVELIYNMMNVDGSSPTHADSVTQKLSQEGVFLAGKSAMTIGPWMVRSIKDLDNYPHDFVTAFAPYPVYAEGQRNFTQGGYGDMLCINPKSEHIEEAWEFIKWFTSTDTQVEYGNDIEALMGTMGRFDTANIEALKRLSWSQSELDLLLAQMEEQIEIPIIPATYAVTRNLTNAFRTVVNDAENPRDTLMWYNKDINAEITRKLEDLGMYS